ncbi:myb-like DNA-binding domain containing protein [Anaeramoeba flamelloides]|uniref:Myb-like DNA-binding domain containing protein n=1 Tax=Anaeramoeba flamelloides TaxID=1746091 RepID=A0AAV7ZP13_9EUKA|nr:myb-like DNA-binding domain containing protein [Anaeramoeba flamelloides]
MSKNHKTKTKHKKKKKENKKLFADRKMIKNSIWSEKEDLKLVKIVKQYKQKNWSCVASYFETKNSTQCLHRWQKVLNPKVKKGRWNKKEDKKLKKYYKQFGTDWSTIAKKIRHRTSKQCRERYKNVLDPKIQKTPWTEEEDEIIIKNYLELGSKWSKIMKHLPGRSDNQIKNRFNCRLKKRLNDFRNNKDYQPKAKLKKLNVPTSTTKRSTKEKIKNQKKTKRTSQIITRSKIINLKPNEKPIETQISTQQLPIKIHKSSRIINKSSRVELPTAQPMEIEKEKIIQTQRKANSKNNNKNQNQNGTGKENEIKNTTNKKRRIIIRRKKSLSKSQVNITSSAKEELNENNSTVGFNNKENTNPNLRQENEKDEENFLFEIYSPIQDHFEFEETLSTIEYPEVYNLTDIKTEDKYNNFFSIEKGFSSPQSKRKRQLKRQYETNFIINKENSRNANDPLNQDLENWFYSNTNGCDGEENHDGNCNDHGFFGLNEKSTSATLSPLKIKRISQTKKNEKLQNILFNSNENSTQNHSMNNSLHFENTSNNNFEFFDQTEFASYF